MKLVFICGALRSGTSLLHLMLDAHPAITNPGEFDFLFDGLTELGEEPSAEQYAAFLGKNRIFNSKPININPACTDYHQLINDLVSQLDGSGVLCLNIHRNYDWAQHYFPQCQVCAYPARPQRCSQVDYSHGLGWKYLPCCRSLDEKRKILGQAGGGRQSGQLV